MKKDLGRIEKFGTYLALVAGMAGIGFWCAQAVKDFRMQSPTSPFGIAAWLCFGYFLMILSALLCIRRAPITKKLFARVALGIISLQALSILPIFLTREALSGVFYVFIAVLSTAILIPVYFLLLKSADYPRRHLWILFSSILTGLTLSWVLRPHSLADCYAIKEGPSKDNCLSHWATKVSDENVCLEVELSSSRATCLREIALAKNQVNICSLIEANQSPEPPGISFDPHEWRDVCYWVMAFQQRNREICAQLWDAKKKSDCVQKVQ